MRQSTSLLHGGGNTGAALPCPVCKEPPASVPRQILIPAHGYVTAAWDLPKRHGDVDVVGYAQPLTLAFQADTADTHRRTRHNFGGTHGVNAIYQSDGEILVFNDGENNGFAICTKCGYADVEKRYAQKKLYTGSLNLPAKFVSHAPLDTPRANAICWEPGSPQVLRQRTLAARVTTDVVQIGLKTSIVVATTLSLALRQAGATLLELDVRELGALTVPTGEDANIYGPVVYDNVPGGAGHTAELFARGREWFVEARQTLFVSPEHHARCGTACLDCILTYEGQHAHEQGLLDRRAALTLLDDLLATVQVTEWEKGETSAASESNESAALTPGISSEAHPINEGSNRDFDEEERARVRRTRLELARIRRNPLDQS